MGQKKRCRHVTGSRGMVPGRLYTTCVHCYCRVSFIRMKLHLTRCPGLKGNTPSADSEKKSWRVIHPNPSRVVCR
jgi:hypothetical protein